MAVSFELKKIKQLYGEEFMKLCRTLFPTILDDGMLLNVLTENFATNTRSLASDIKRRGMEEAFTDFVYSKYDKMKSTSKETTKTTKTPYEILSDAGYNLYEATTYGQTLEYRKYYEQGEELCTFDDTQRVKRCVCFWAIRKNVEEFKRDYGTEAFREDLYSTSVLAIQFTKSKRARVSIKSRYNHTVDNPDAVFGNDLELLAPGLTESFEELLVEKGFSLKTKEEENLKLPRYKKGPDDKYYKYNLRINGTYYCPGNIVFMRDRMEEFSNPEKEILIDNYLLDLSKKTLTKVWINEKSNGSENDSFLDAFHNIEKISRTRDKKSGETTFRFFEKDSDTPITLVTNEFNEIVSYTNEKLTAIGDNFMIHNRALKNLNLPNVKSVGSYFLEKNSALKNIDMPNLQDTGDYFLLLNDDINKIYLPNLQVVGNYFMASNEKLKEAVFPELTKTGIAFFRFNEKVENFYAPKLKKVEWNFFSENKRFKDYQVGQTIGSIDLAKLDKSAKVTKSEIEKIDREIDKKEIEK